MLSSSSSSLMPLLKKASGPGGVCVWGGDGKRVIGANISIISWKCGLETQRDQDSSTWEGNRYKEMVYRKIPQHLNEIQHSTVLQRKWDKEKEHTAHFFSSQCSGDESSPEQINTQHICNAAMTNNLALGALCMCEGLKRANRGWRLKREDDNLWSWWICRHHQATPRFSRKVRHVSFCNMGVRNDPNNKWFWSRLPAVRADSVGSTAVSFLWRPVRIKAWKYTICCDEKEKLGDQISPGPLLVTVEETTRVFASGEPEHRFLYVNTNPSSAPSFHTDLLPLFWICSFLLY